MATSNNISSLLPASLLSKLINTNQVLVPNQQQLQKVIIGNQGLSQNQDNTLISLNERKRQARINKQNIIKDARNKLRNKKITQEQFNNIEKTTNETYDEEIASIETNKQQVRQSKDGEIKNFQRTIRNEENKIRTENNKLKLRTSRAEVRAKIDLAKQILTNPDTLLLIYPGLGLLITNAFLNFITQRKKLEKQVDAVNLYIDTKVIDEATVIIATNLKNDTIRAINNAINKLKAIEAVIKVINTALKIASVVLKLVTLIPVPVPMPILKLFDKLSRIIAGLSSILTVCLRILSNEIIRLKELIERLKQIIIKLNNKTLNILTDDQLLRLIQTFLPVGDVIFPTLTAQPLEGVTGAVNIGGRIVYLNTVNPAPGTAGNNTLAGAAISGSISGSIIGGVNIPPPLTGVVGGVTQSIVTGSNGSTNGTGLGLTTTGGTGNGGTNVGPTGTIPGVSPTLGGVNDLGGLGTEIGLDSGNTNDLVLTGQSLFPININQISLGGLDEAGLNELEQLPLELIQEEKTPALQVEQVPSLNDQASLYKGFRFQIKEEQDPKFVVRGSIKRRYAVAINRQGVEVLKSEYSFTLDPQDLVDQLKLVIDRQKLQG